MLQEQGKVTGVTGTSRGCTPREVCKARVVRVGACLPLSLAVLPLKSWNNHSCTQQTFTSTPRWEAPWPARQSLPLEIHLRKAPIKLTGSAFYFYGHRKSSQNTQRVKTSPMGAMMSSPTRWTKTFLWEAEYLCLFTCRILDINVKKPSITVLSTTTAESFYPQIN